MSSKRWWTRYASLYDRLWAGPLTDELSWAVVRQAGVPTGVTADFGCGTGLVTYVLVRNGHTVVGIDANAALLRAFAARLPGTNVILRSVENLPLARHSVHTAVATNLLHLHPRPTFVLEQLADVIEPAGQIICSWPYDDAGPWRVARAEHGAGVGIGVITARTGGRLAVALTAPRSFRRIPSDVLSWMVETFARTRAFALTSFEFPVAQQSVAVLRGGTDE